MRREDEVTPDDVRRQLALEEHSRQAVARFRANKAFMARMRDAYEAKLRHERTPWKDLKHGSA